MPPSPEELEQIPRTGPGRLGDFAPPKSMIKVTGLALLVGAIAAGVAFLLLKLIGLLDNLFFYGRVAFDLAVPSASPWYLVFFVPIAGGLAVGLMARYGSEGIRGHGIPEALESILTDGSKMQPKLAILKPISAAISIGTGGPFGAEGPIIMTGGAFGSVFSQLLKLTADQRKTLLVAGAAAGMAATFNAPLASILLAVELLLFEWKPRSLVPVAAAVVVSTIIRGYLLGTGPIFPVPHVALHLSPLVYVFCAVAGALGGVLAVGATGIVYFAEDTFTKLRHVHWMWWPAIGGVIVGIGGLIQPKALSVGYGVIHDLLLGQNTLYLVVSILIVKTLIWGLSLGSGTSGGVLAPTFMMGAALGGLEAYGFPQVGGGFWALMGLAAVVGGVMRSPFTGIIFSLELTHLWGALLPIVVSSVVAYAVSVLILKRSVITEKVARRGAHLSREYTVDPLETMFGYEVMWREIVTFPASAPLTYAVRTFISGEHTQYRDHQHRQRLYPVLDENNKLCGLVTRRDMLDVALTNDQAKQGEQSNDPRTVADIMVSNPLTVYADQTLREIANALSEKGLARAPVVARDDPTKVLGLVTATQLLQGRARHVEEEYQPERILHMRLIPGLGWDHSGMHATPGEADLSREEH
jgi:H+/Cl- antiporter ClcA/predicted transcriptional regulator